MFNIYYYFQSPIQMVTLSGNKASGGTWQQNIGNCLSLFHHQDTQITNHIQAHIVLIQAAAPSTPGSDKPIEDNTGSRKSYDWGKATPTKMHKWTWVQLTNLCHMKERRRMWHQGLPLEETRRRRRCASLKISHYLRSFWPISGLGTRLLPLLCYYWCDGGRPSWVHGLVTQFFGIWVCTHTAAIEHNRHHLGR